MKLTEKYAGKPTNELPLLFQRILQNTIRDFYRRQKIRSLWTTLFSSLTPKGQGKDGDDYDPLKLYRSKETPISATIRMSNWSNRNLLVLLKKQ